MLTCLQPNIWWSSRGQTHTVPVIHVKSPVSEVMDHQFTMYPSLSLRPMGLSGSDGTLGIYQCALRSAMNPCSRILQLKQRNELMTIYTNRMGFRMSVRFASYHQSTY